METEAYLSVLTDLARQQGFTFRNGFTYVQEQPGVWTREASASANVVDMLRRNVPQFGAANKFVVPYDLVQHGVAHLCKALPAPAVNSSAISFAGGEVYNAATDSLVGSTGSCWRHVPQRAADSACLDTPAFDVLMEASGIPKHHVCALLGKLLQPRAAVASPDTPLYFCTTAEPRRDAHGRCLALPSAVESLLACMVPAEHWCRVSVPFGMADDIRRAKAARLLVADVRQWQSADVSRVLRLAASDQHAKAMHVVLVTSAGQTLPPALEGNTMLQLDHCSDESAAQLAADLPALIRVCARQFLQQAAPATGKGQGTTQC